jgi:outer membrane lipoprotein-sorting protein
MVHVEMKKLHIVFIAALLSLMLPAGVAHALTGEEALAKFQARMNSIGTMSGVISWTHQSGETYIGGFKYMAPGKLHIKFNTPGGRVLVTNGRRLWVYDSSSNVCGVQDMEKGGSGGIAGFVNGYLAILTAQGPSGCTLKLKSPDKTYADITLVLDGSFMLKKAVFATKDGDGFSVTLSNIKTGESMISGVFDFSVPSNAQIVKNPLDVK